MNLNLLLENLDQVNTKNFENFDVKSLSCSSTDNNQNGIYFCLNGTKVDGHNFADEAIKNGAKCLVVERFLNNDVCQVLVKNARKAMTEMSAKFYKINNSKMKFIGITGTNGKTTTSFLIKKYLSKMNKRVGLIGTQGIYFNHLLLPAKLTTPDPIELYRVLSEMEQSGIEYVVMEVSAHAVALNKIDGINYDVVALTNITQDHLDFFKNMNNYADAKQQLFSLKHAKKAIINIDDDYSYNIANNCEIDKETLSLNEDADMWLEDYETNLSGTKAIFKSNGETLPIKTNLVGRYNIANTMMAISILHSLGFDYEQILNTVNTTRVEVPGRFNVLKIPADYSVVIDYAHTPDGIENVIKTARNLTDGRIISVFGCGGDRDSSKRKTMGEISERYADFSIITSDNPRTENPNLIIKDITQNMTKNYVPITNRKEAIIHALNIAKEGDVILILGKGAESYQEINGVRYPYSDYEVIDNYFKNNEFVNIRE